MIVEYLTVENPNERVDVLISRNIDELTRSAVQKLLDKELILSDGKPLKKNSKLKTGSVIEVYIPEPESLDIKPQNIPLNIVYEDEDVIVINKPVGMVVHPAPGHTDGTLVNALLYHCGNSLSGINGVMRPGIVHRIDKDTSGLIIAAKNDKAHLSLAEQLQTHTLARTYECIAVGGFKEDSGTISAPIGRHKTDRKKMAVISNGKPAVTHWQVLERYSGYTRLECQLETGRTHQIRVHLAYINHPLLGDVVYGNKKPYGNLAGQCLHAKRLQFIHPRTNELVTVECPLPDWFEECIKKLR